MTRTAPSHALKAIPIFYSERMVADIESFSPSAGKPRDVVQSWRALGLSLHIVSPQPVSVDQLCLAHDRDYVEDILACRTKNGFGNTSAAVAATLPWTSGAMLSAAREAIANGRVAVAPCSGFHHASHDSCHGFCTFNGLMVTAAVLLHEGRVARVGILDCDAHYGDGTEAIRSKLYLEDHVPHYTTGATWTRPDQAQAFLRTLPSIVESFTGCDVLLYQAGADPHVDDPLGGWLTTAQLAERDRIVFETARRIGLPVAWNLAGGYQTPLRRVLDIHDNSLRICAHVFVATSDAAYPPAPEPTTSNNENINMSPPKNAKTDACRTCCYWSELIAKTRGGALVAMCLAEQGPRAWRYTRDDANCAAWQEARDGAIDDPETGHLARARVQRSTDQDILSSEGPGAHAGRS
jgi:acetoin utilization deacetylase AcuC-like enzyme